jgi:hypothetical protein
MRFWWLTFWRRYAVVRTDTFDIPMGCSDWDGNQSEFPVTTFTDTVIAIYRNPNVANFMVWREAILTRAIEPNNTNAREWKVIPI